MVAFFCVLQLNTLYSVAWNVPAADGATPMAIAVDSPGTYLYVTGKMESIYCL